jgi:hypothetical protein
MVKGFSTMGLLLAQNPRPRSTPQIAAAARRPKTDGSITQLEKLHPVNSIPESIANLARVLSREVLATQCQLATIIKDALSEKISKT